MQHINFEPPKPKRVGAKPKKYDNVFVGILLGIIVPIVGILLINALLRKGVGVTIDTMKGNYGYNAAAKILSLGMIANLIPFYLFINKNRFNITRGILVSTALYLIVFVFYKFIL